MRSPSVDAGPPGRPRFRCGLGTMMLWIALVALCLGAMSAATAMGIVAFLVLAPILVRTLAVVDRRAALGRPIGLETWAFAGTGSTRCVLRSWVMASVSYLIGYLSTLSIASGLAFVRTGDSTLSLTHFRVSVAVAVIAAVGGFVASARRSWVIRDWEVGRAPGRVDP